MPEAALTPAPVSATHGVLDAMIAVKESTELLIERIRLPTRPDLTVR